MSPAQAIATLGGIGKLPGAPGTYGSLAALPLGYLLHGLGGFTLLALATIFVTVVGWWATRLEEKRTSKHDAGEIVIDEVVGQWIALWPVSYGLGQAGVDPWVFPWPGWVGAFVLFRLFDIWKPGPVGWADRQEGAIGVMLDDVFAGVLAALGVALAAFIAHGVIGI